MICSNCGTRNPTNNRTCNICSEKLERKTHNNDFHNKSPYIEDDFEIKNISTDVHKRSTRKINQPIIENEPLQKTNAYEHQQSIIQNEQLMLQRQQLQMQQDQLNVQQQMRQQQQQYQAQAKYPRCGSTSLSGNKKGFGIGKAVVDVATMGLIGAVA